MFPYTNNDFLLEYQNLPAIGTYYDTNAELLIPSSPFNIMTVPYATLEAHVYDLQGNYLTGINNVNSNYWYINVTGSNNVENNIAINLAAQLNDIGIKRGQYLTVLNLHQPQIGASNNASYYISDISTNRTELRLKPIQTSNQFLSEYQTFLSTYIEQKEYAINSTNAVFPPWDTAGYNFGTPPGTLLTDTYYFSDPAIQLAFDTYITNLVNNQIFYNGTTFIGSYEVYAGVVERRTIETILWFAQANIKITPASIEKFAPEINIYRSNVTNTLTVIELRALLATVNTLVREFWRRNDDGSFKHISLAYFSSFGPENTLIKAGFSLLPFKYPDKYILNFGNNNIAKIVNFAFDANSYNLIVKLASPLDIQFQELDRGWIAFEIISPVVEKILLVNILSELIGNQLRGPNFDINVEEAQSIATSLQSWNDLLSANVTTNQQIIDKYFGNSLSGIKLNVNYGEFDNFIHFSSAEERVENFKYKLELIEYYTARINTLSSSTGSIGANLVEATTNRDNVISGFDGFEKYLFYEQTGSQLYTFSSCSVQPWPKQNVSSSLITYAQQVSTTSSIAETYYSDLLEKAQIYDRFNIHSLRKSIPLHIGSDEYNADYILFVDMIGHYYDIIWSYIKHMTDNSIRQENPKDGIAQDLIYYIAKSLGVDVYNGKSAQELWKYALGVDTAGSYIQTGSMQSLSYEDTTKEVWRRIVNNLPYLYKTKGTARSIKALLSCYGIPTTILNIKEYGGVNSDQNDLQPYYIHDVYTYAHVATGSADNYVITPWQSFTRERYNISATTSQYPDVIEFRFRPDDNFTYLTGTEYSLLRSDVNQPLTGSIWSQIQTQWVQTAYTWASGAPTVETIGDPFFEITFERQGTHSGSLNLYLSGSNGFLSASINNIYTFDNNWITVVLQRNVSNDLPTVPSQSYSLKYQKGLYGKIVSSGSASINLAGNSSSGSYNQSWTSGSYILFGKGGLNAGVAGGQTQKFYGLYQELRYWYDILDDSSIQNHTLSPYSYNGNYHYSAYYDLIFRASLSRKDLVVNSTFGYMQMLSHHPNQTLNVSSSAIFVNRYSNTIVPFEAVEETYYTEYADLTAHVIYGDKIRIESQSLSAPLNPNKRVTETSYDFNSTDSNKLGIYFSPQNGINEDIVNHLGYLSLDDYIGDPRDQYQPSYRHLDLLRDEYWKKYDNKNNFEAYFNALRLYDLSVFRQIKKFVPARANLISGIVIEPNLLERVKVRYINKPEIDDLVYNADISGIFNNTCTGSYIDTINIEYTNVVSMTGSYDNNLSQTIQLYDIQPNIYEIGTYNSSSNINVLPNVVLVNVEDFTVSDGWFEGTQSTSAGINVPSADTYDLGPVVSVFTTNPNVIITEAAGYNSNLMTG